MDARQSDDDRFVGPQDVVLERERRRCQSHIIKMSDIEHVGRQGTGCYGVSISNEDVLYGSRNGRWSIVKIERDVGAECEQIAVDLELIASDDTASTRQIEHQT